MPPKKKLADPIQKIVAEVKQKEQQEIANIIQEEKIKRKGEWDVPIGTPIEYFDADLSYELTGYKPIDSTRGLDFDPEWFCETRNTYLKTGHYTQSRGKRYADFWKEQYRRCRDGLTINGYTVTGDHYFFLNFYQLPIVNSDTKSAGGRQDGFPRFFVSQYTFFHYYELAKKLHKHTCLMKARSIGFSEINASIAANIYTIIPKSNIMIACHDEGKVSKTLRKVWHALDFLDMHTDGGMKRLRQIKNTDKIKTSGYIVDKDGAKIQTGWLSTIQGVVADDPQKIRGDRVDILIYDEAGSWKGLIKAVIQGEALVTVQGVRFGIIQMGGTGGDSGPALEGLREIYYHPEPFGVLPYKHNFTQTGETILSGFFIPYFQQLMVPGFVDHRGYCDPNKAKEYLQKERDRFSGTPKSYLIYCAEHCWNAEEAFNLEGDNKFNKIKIADQLANIRLHKLGPKPIRGYLDYIYKNSQHTKENIAGFRWTPNETSEIQILEHPIWSDEYTQQVEKLRKYNQENNIDEDPSVYQKYQKMDGLYVAGIDGIDIGAKDTSENTKNASDFCMIIYKRAFGLQDPKIVALYKERPNDQRTAYRNAMILAQYYNSRINIEATRVAMLNWARDRGYLSYFMKRPRATLTDIQKGVSKQYGTPATKNIIEMQTDLIAEFIEDYSYTIWFEEILEELNRYTDEEKGKFDTVAAMGMAMLADQELSSWAPIVVEQQENTFQDIGYYIDEYGIKRYGIIPDKNQTKFNISWDISDNNFRRTSDPRYR